MRSMDASLSTGPVRRPLRLVVALLILAALAAGAWILVASLQAKSVEADAAGQAAAEAAAEADATLERMSARVASLQKRIEKLESDGDRLGARVGRIGDRLWSAVGNLRAALHEARSNTVAANDAAAGALQRAEAAARDLTVLEDRFDYHLRSHGN
jgi:cell division protein FtsB